MNQVALATARGRPAALSLRASAPKLSAGQLTVGTDRVNRHFSAMANVVTIEELREFKQLKAMLPAVVAAAEGLSNYDAGDELRGITQLNRMIAQDRLRWIRRRIQELEYKLGSSNAMQRF
jgi:hypothetical protein